MKCNKPILFLLVTAVLCGSSFRPAAVSDASPSEDISVIPHTIGICAGNDNDYYSYEVLGFKDAVINNLDDKGIVFAEQNHSDSISASTAVETLIQARSSLIYVIGDSPLEAASNLTSDIPVVFSNVMDYRNVLHLLPDTGSITGRNITGVSGIPSAERQLSLLIEAASHNPKAVGILYDPADTNSILQNEMMEDYMNNAKISWREYEIKDASIQEAELTEAADNTDLPVALPSISAAPSGKEGSNIHPDSIGESGDLTGINEPMSARSVQISPLWKDPADLSGLSWQEITDLACDQCDVLYICSGNKIADDLTIMSYIRDRASASNTVTVGGDSDIGENTTVCLYQDPYLLGYKCGEIAAQILLANEDIQEIPITGINPSYTTKLYNETLSKEIGKTWPKSFYERDSFLSDYSSEGLAEASRRISKKE